MFKKWKNAFILLLIISFCIVGFASAAQGDGNGSKTGQKFKSQLIETKAKSLPEPTGTGTYGNPYVFETCVVYQFWGPCYGWTDMAFVDASRRGENSFIFDCPMESWSKVQTAYGESKCQSAGVKTYWWGGYYEGSFSSPSGLSTGKHYICPSIGEMTFYYIVNEQSPPEASFTFTPTSGYVPLTVTFTDTSTGSPSSWLWNFGDGNTSTEQNPVHVYTSPGIFYVSLTVSNCGGSDTTTSTNSITGSASVPVADFTGTPTSGYSSLTVQFNDTSTGSPTSWSWNFGDGQTSTLQNPSHEYTSPGTYTVSLTVTSSVGSDTETKPGYVTVTEHFNEVTNVKGINESQTPFSNIIDVAANAQLTLGYSPSNFYYYEGNISNLIQPRLDSSAIFFSHSHGLPGIIEVNEDQPEYYFGRDGLSGYNFDDVFSYNRTRLAVFLGCHTGETSSTYGNLVNIIVNKEGGCAIGWTNIIIDYGVHAYGPVFWDEIQNELPIHSAHYNGVEAAREDPVCQSLEPEIEACWMGSVYCADNDQKCYIPLPRGTSKQLIEKENSQFNRNDLENLPKEDIERAYAVIQKFENKINMNLTLKKIIQQPYADLYKFDTDGSSYWINSNTGRIQSVLWYEDGLKNKEEKINLDQGYAIAEVFVKEKYPELWDLTDKKGIKLVRKETQDLGSTCEQHFMWQEILYSSDQNSFSNQEISGMNYVSVIINPYSRNIISYNERYQTLDPNLNLVPTLSQEQAWKFADSYFYSVGIKNIYPTERKCYGLQIAEDDKNNQHLVWKFEVMQKDEHGFDIGGWVGIDAHDGEFVWHASID